MRKPFSFGLVRYVHDPVSGEFLNVGVVVYSPAGHYLKARCTQRYGRLSSTFGEVRGQHFRSLMEFVEQRVNSYGRDMAWEEDGQPETPVGVFGKLFTIDDSSLQFGGGGGGLTEDFDVTLNGLYERFVGRFEVESSLRKGDSDVWRDSRGALERFGVVQHLTMHRVASETFSYDFQHALKNGTWNALEPVSLDLSSADKIKDKANKWLGRTYSLEGAAGDLKLYYLLGRPRGGAMQAAYAQAKDILDKSPIQHEIIEEDGVEDLAAELRDKIREHEDPDLGLG